VETLGALEASAADGGFVVVVDGCSSFLIHDGREYTQIRVVDMCHSEMCGVRVWDKASFLSAIESTMHMHIPLLVPAKNSLHSSVKSSLLSIYISTSPYPPYSILTTHQSPSHVRPLDSRLHVPHGHQHLLFPAPVDPHPTHRHD
jgi:hypothetical protein